MTTALFGYLISITMDFCDFISPFSFSYSGFSKETSWKFSFILFIQCQIAVKFLRRMRDVVTLMSTYHGVTVEEDNFLRWRITTDTVYNSSKRVQNTQTDVERFRNGSVIVPFDRSLYERTFMTGPAFNEKHALSTRLSYLILIRRNIRQILSCLYTWSSTQQNTNTKFETFKEQEREGWRIWLCTTQGVQLRRWSYCTA